MTEQIYNSESDLDTFHRIDLVKCELINAFMFKMFLKFLYPLLMILDFTYCFTQLTVFKIPYQHILPCLFLILLYSNTLSKFC